jgi:hypothetical protein
MDVSVARVTLEGITPMYQSKWNTAPKLNGESPADYEVRTWRSKTNTEQRDGIEEVFIPGSAIRQMLYDASKYSKKQIPGQGKATWSKKFEAGVAALSHAYLGIDLQSLTYSVLQVPPSGVRGDGKRVTKYFPVIPKGWRTEVEIHILDPMITEPVFSEMIVTGGMFIGFGSFRPQKLGQYGRFQLVNLVWEDNRSFV